MFTKIGWRVPREVRPAHTSEHSTHCAAKFSPSCVCKNWLVGAEGAPSSSKPGLYNSYAGNLASFYVRIDSSSRRSSLRQALKIMIVYHYKSFSAVELFRSSRKCSKQCVCLFHCLGIRKHASMSELQNSWQKENAGANFLILLQQWSLCLATSINVRSQGAINSCCHANLLYEDVMCK